MSNTASLTALPPPRLNTSDAVNYLLTRHGIRVAESTMKQWAWRGGGPEFQKSGPHRLYPVERLNVWAEQRLTPVVASTSELNQPADNWPRPSARAGAGARCAGDDRTQARAGGSARCRHALRIAGTTGLSIDPKANQRTKATA